MPELTELQASMLPILWGAFALPETADGPWPALRAAEEALASGERDAAAQHVGTIDLDTAESLVAIRAARLLRQAGASAGGTTVFGVLLVVPLEAWTDLLAVYADGAIRYYNGAPPAGSGAIVDGMGLRATAVELLDVAVGALAGASVQQVAAPLVDLAFPTATLFRADGEVVGRLDQRAGEAVLAAGAQVIADLDAGVRDSS